MIYAYIRLADLKYPIFEGLLRLEFPHIKEEQTGESLPCPEGYAPVMDDPPLQIDLLVSGYLEEPPKLIGGVWRRQWSYFDHSPEEKLRLAKSVRNNDDIITQLELRKARAAADIEDENQADWQDYVRRLEEYLDEYPHTGERPVLIRNVAQMNNPGSAPNVVG